MADKSQAVINMDLNQVFWEENYLRFLKDGKMVNGDQRDSRSPRADSQTFSEMFVLSNNPEHFPNNPLQWQIL